MALAQSWTRAGLEPPRTIPERVPDQRAARRNSQGGPLSGSVRRISETGDGSVLETVGKSADFARVFPMSMTQTTEDISIETNKGGRGGTTGNQHCRQMHITDWTELSSSCHGVNNWMGRRAVAISIGGSRGVVEIERFPPHSALIPENV